MTEEDVDALPIPQQEHFPPRRHPCHHRRIDPPSRARLRGCGGVTPLLALLKLLLLTSSLTAASSLSASSSPKKGGNTNDDIRTTSCSEHDRDDAETDVIDMGAGEGGEGARGGGGLHNPPAPPPLLSDRFRPLPDGPSYFVCVP